jgi:hypothetical protein
VTTLKNYILLDQKYIKMNFLKITIYFFKMSFSSLPDELFHLVLDCLRQKSRNKCFAQQFVMLHVNKFCSRNTTQWFHNIQQWFRGVQSSFHYNCARVGKDNLFYWACSYKKAKNPLSLVKWTEIFPFSEISVSQQSPFYQAIKTDNKALINYLIFEKELPASDQMLPWCILHNNIKLFDYFQELVPRLPKHYYRDYFRVSTYNLYHIIEALAIKGWCGMLNKYLKLVDALEKTGIYTSLYEIVLKSDELNEFQKLEVIKILYENRIIHLPQNTWYAINKSYNIIFEWMVKNKVYSIDQYFVACNYKNTKAILILLDNDVVPSTTDIEHIEKYVESGCLDTETTNLILDKLDKYY